MKRTDIATVLAIVVLLVSTATAVAAYAPGRSSLTESQIRTGEIDCLIVERAAAHGIGTVSIPATAASCRTYVLTLRRP